MAQAERFRQGDVVELRGRRTVVTTGEYGVLVQQDEQEPQLISFLPQMFVNLSARERQSDGTGEETPTPADFREGDVVELRGRGTVAVTDARFVYVRPEGLFPIIIAVPRQMLINLSDAREISEEEARGLLEDEL